MEQTPSTSKRSNADQGLRSSTRLRLIPLSKEKCCALLQQKGVIFKNPIYPSTHSDNACDECRNILDLKLCHSSSDKVDVDNYDLSSEKSIVYHARRLNNGQFTATVCLGRSECTGICSKSVSRALCDVSLTQTCNDSIPLSHDIDLDKRQLLTLGTMPNGDSLSGVASLSMRKPPGMHSVHLNGRLVDLQCGVQVPLKHRDVISLYGQTSFTFRVELSSLWENDNQGEETESLHKNSNQQYHKDDDKNSTDCVNLYPCKKSKLVTMPVSQATQTSPSPQQTRHQARKLMIHECTCSMCLEILVKSTFAYPCSHAFCAECAANCNDVCPNCRGSIHGWMPARSYDTMIWTTALQGFFDKDNAEHYLKKRKENGEADPTNHEMECIFRENDILAEKYLTTVNEEGGDNLSINEKKFILSENGIHTEE